MAVKNPDSASAATSRARHAGSFAHSTEIEFLLDGTAQVVAASALDGDGQAVDWVADLPGRDLAAVVPGTDGARLATSCRACAGDGQSRSLDIVAGERHFRACVRVLATITGERQLLCHLQAVQDGAGALEAAVGAAGVAWFARELCADRGECAAAYADLFGVPRAHGYHAHEYIARVLHDDRAPYEAWLDALAAGDADEAGATFQLRIMHPARGMRHIELQARGTRLYGRPAVCGIAVDVTERVRAAAVLRDNREWLSTAMEAVDFVLWELNPETREVRTSANAGTFFGRPGGRERWQMGDFLPAVHAADRGAVESAYGALLQAGTPMQVRYRVAAPDGAGVRWLETYAHRQRGAAVPGRVIGVTRDVTPGETALRELRQSEARLARAMQQAQIAPFEWDLHSGRVSGPPSLGRLLGVTGTGPWQVADIVAAAHPSDRADIEAFVANPPTHLALFSLEFRVVQPNQRTTWIESRCASTVDADGISVTGVVMDVTERHQLAARRAETEQRFTDIVALVPGVVFQLVIPAADEPYLAYVSEGARELFGLSEHAGIADLAGLLACIHADDRRHVTRGVLASARDGTLWRAEFRVRGDNAAERWLLGQAAARAGASGDVLLHGHLMDITHQKGYELDLRGHQARLELALAAARMTAWYWERDSDAFIGFGLPGLFPTQDEGERHLREVLARIHPEDAARLDAALRCEDAAADAPLKIRTGSDTQAGLSYELHMRPRRNAAGAVIGYDGVAQDVTRRERDAAEREGMRRQLEHAQKMESIGLLTGGIAHDFNNIVGAVLGFSTLALRRLERGQVDPEKLHEYLRHVRTAGERARDLVRQLLAFSRAEPAAASAVDLAALVDESLSLLRPTLPSSLDIRCHVPAGLPLALVDPVQFEQVLFNLCINARDALEGQGHVRIALSEHQGSGHCASCHESFAGHFLRLDVADDGPGIPAHLADHLFEPFASDKAPGKGTGMGLAMVHGLVHGHGGHILLDQPPGGGARFGILLPLAGADAAVTAASERANSAPPVRTIAGDRTVHVLAVDDEPALGRLLSELLDLEGCETTVYTDPVSAIARFRDDPTRFDLVITDQTMPRMTGIAFAQVIREIDPRVPIVMLSGNADLVANATVAESGVDLLLSKPLDEDALLGAMRRLLEARDNAP